MKIAIICPIGDLHRFGYWRVASFCLESWKVIGDLFLIHSSRTVIPFDIKANYIRDDDTLMSVTVDPDGKWGEWYDHRIVAANANRGIDTACAMGYDVAITICVNWYVERPAGIAIREKCEWLLSQHSDYDYLYRRIQIGPHLFEADMETIAVLNLHKVQPEPCKVLVDTYEINGATVKGRRGDYAARNGEAYIDCEHELTTEELQEKLADIRNYEELVPKRRGVDWAYWQRYYRERAKRLVESFDQPGEVGRCIAALHPSGAFGDWLLEQAKVTA